MIGRWAASLRVLVVFGLVAGSGASATTATAGAAIASPVVGPAGGVVSWGANGSGQLGDGSTAGHSIAGTVNGLSGGVVQVQASNGVSLALRADGTVVAWGSNDAGQLGNATVGPGGSTVPVVVTGVTGVTQISAGGAFALARRADGRVYEWGDNQRGEGGDPAHTEAVRPPALVPGLSDIVEVSAGSEFAMARDSHGTVWTWGRNLAHSLGDPAQGDDTFVRYTPAPVPGIPDAIGIEASWATGFVIRADRTLWAWGFNTTYATGISGVLTIPGAQQVPVLTDVRQVASSYGSTLVLRGDGTVWGMGYNYEGEILAGGADVQHQHNTVAPPVQLAGLPVVSQVDTTDATSLALAADGRVWVWGSGAEGLYGDGRGNVGIEAGLHVVTGLSHVTSIAGSAHRELSDATQFHSHVVVVTSDTPARTVMPNLVGLGCPDAMALLTAYGLLGSCPYGPGPTVVAQDPPPGTELLRGTVVWYMLCSTVPGVVGLAADRARQLIAAQGLGVSSSTITDSTCENLGEVATQSPDPGTRLTPGATVDIRVWSRPSKCPVNPP